MLVSLTMQAFMTENYIGKQGVLLASLGTIAELGMLYAETFIFAHCCSVYMRWA